jgi:hypothetical protein
LLFRLKFFAGLDRRGNLSLVNDHGRKANPATPNAMARQR